MSVSVYGLKDKFPNGSEGYLWTDARVIWTNGACLNVQNTLSFPDDGPGSNTQHIAMYCSGGDKGAMIRHSDQYRGIEYSYIRKAEFSGSDGVFGAKRRLLPVHRLGRRTPGSRRLWLPLHRLYYPAVHRMRAVRG